MMDTPGLGHNSGEVTIAIEVRLFNSLSRYAEGGAQRLVLPAGATVGAVLRRLGVPPSEVFLVLRNGRDVTPGLVGAGVNEAHELDDGDVVALSGPVPFSFGYGAPVV
jgi:molybdopterin converting factor small subunit